MSDLFFPVPGSTLCRERPDGNYGHNVLDLGDPRCTFLMCSNYHTVVQSCPMGSRTSYLLGRSIHNGEKPMNISNEPFLDSTKGFDPVDDGTTTQMRDKTDYMSDNNLQGNPGRMAKNAIEDEVIPREEYLTHFRHFLRIRGSRHGICDFHDVFGDCGHPFPPAINFDNTVPTLEDYHALPLIHWVWYKMVAIFADDIFKCIFLNENFRI